MLNPYFAFGVPIFLLCLYIVFAIIRKKSKLHYIGFVLLLIATFMMAFSFQVLQGLWTLEDSHSTEQLNKLSYSPELLWIPLILGGVLAVLNLWRGVKRVQSFREDSK
jgi:NADH:ubiquinone oxidoreductase subunit 5 (subunit L)/multisubunit Na+/H+ antiporter MnhA subunit